MKQEVNNFSNFSTLIFSNGGSGTDTIPKTESAPKMLERFSCVDEENIDPAGDGNKALSNSETASNQKNGRVNFDKNVENSGALYEDFDEYKLIHIALDQDRMQGRLPWGVELPLNPFFGVMGTAPPENWGMVRSIEPRAFGGNLECKELGVGARIFFPVFVYGANFPPKVMDSAL